MDRSAGESGSAAESGWRSSQFRKMQNTRGICITGTLITSISIPRKQNRRNPSKHPFATSTTGSAVYRFGPYLTTMPSNPLNGKSAVKMTTDFTYDSSGVYGWLYNPVTQQIVANNSGTDTNGQTYISY